MHFTHLIPYSVLWWGTGGYDALKAGLAERHAHVLLDDAVDLSVRASVDLVEDVGVPSIA